MHHQILGLGVSLFLWSTVTAVLTGRMPYAPRVVREDIPRTMIRDATAGLHPDEILYRSERKSKERVSLMAFLKQAAVDFDVEEYDSVIGLAMSGGGYRAMLLGAGQLAALDNRTTGSNEAGLGGLLQATSYISGLSGGSWLLGSLYFNGFPTIDSLVHNKHLWQLERSPIFHPEVGPFKNVRRYRTFIQELASKRAAGFPITITDLWGRALTRQFVDSSKRGPLLWSDLRNETWYQDRDAPYPIVLVNGRSPIHRRAAISTAIYEVTPLEFGSFDHEIDAFIDTQYLGTPIYNGKSLIPGYAVKGVDDVGFILGTSSALFDQIIIGVIEKLTRSKRLADSARLLLNSLGVMELRDVAAVGPNPFFGYNRESKGRNKGTDNDSKLRDFHDGVTLSPILYLSDGGSNKQSIPVQSLIEPDREVDVLIAFDNGGTQLENAWPDGASISRSYLRQFMVPGSPVFPHVPDPASFVNLDLAMRPTFFGCDGRNMSDLMLRSGQTHTAPLLVYMPNQPISYQANTSTFKLSYTRSEISAMLTNGFNVATQGNRTLDPDWPVCLGCAITQRSRERKGHALTPKCEECFNRYCWDGSIDDDEKRAKSKGEHRYVSKKVKATK